MGRSPAAARRRLGMDLRGLREAAGLKIEDAARKLECSTAKISRLETGKGVPYARDVRDLIDLYGNDAKAHRDELLELVEDGRAQDWYSAFRDVTHGGMSADHLIRFMELEQDAAEMNIFNVDLIPGLLQTEVYIDAVCSFVYPDSSVDERKRFVQFRRKRQEAVLNRGQKPRLNIVVHELAIVRRMGKPAVMREQLETLRNDLAGPLRDIEFQLVPLRAEARGALGGPFWILKYDTAGGTRIWSTWKAVKVPPGSRPMPMSPGTRNFSPACSRTASRVKNRWNGSARWLKSSAERRRKRMTRSAGEYS